MELEYHEWEKRRRQAAAGTTARRAASKRKQRERSRLGPREKRRLTQLVICLLLFFGVFIGKGIFPQKMEQVRVALLETLEADTDFQAAFSNFGRALSAGKPISDAVGDLCVAVFGLEQDTVLVMGTAGNSTLFHAEATYWNRFPEREQPADHWLARIPKAWFPERIAPEPSSVPEEPAASPEPEVPAVETVAYDGPALPENTTMDKYNLSVLGIEETVTPASGWLSSPFGWREHPVDGGNKFHNGVDLAVNTGTVVQAFAAGTVDYIGENESYGKYVQIDHGSGVTSFYAHCSELCVRQGQAVSAGEKIAESGETGNTTGPHLHFEMKVDGIRINPEYYIELN